MKKNESSTRFLISLLFLSLLLPQISLGQTTEKLDNVLGYIKVHQQYRSGIRGGQCPTFPSCSVYGYESFRQKGFAKGMLLTADRLLLCGHQRNNN